MGGLNESLDVSGNAGLVDLSGLGEDSSEALANLNTVNASGTGVAEVAEVGKLNSLPNLRNLNLSDSPVSGTDNYRIEVIILLPRLKNLDEERITEEERTEAAELVATRAAEAAAAAAAAEEEGDE